MNASAQGVQAKPVPVSRLVVIFAMAGMLAEGLFQGAFGFWARLRHVRDFSKDGWAVCGLAEAKP
jgi:hypothetical protein